jgi:hypothetical protein
MSFLRRVNWPVALPWLGYVGFFAWLAYEVWLRV